MIVSEPLGGGMAPCPPPLGSAYVSVESTATDHGWSVVANGSRERMHFIINTHIVSTYILTCISTYILHI